MTNGTRSNPRTTNDYAGIAAWSFKLTVSPIGSFDTAERAAQEASEGLGAEHIGTDRVKYVQGSAGFGTAYAHKIGPQMYVCHHGDHIDVILYDTPIVRYYRDGTFSVDNGGHNTPTTTERLNAVTPDGFHAYHHAKRLGLMGPGSEFAQRRKVQGPNVLWPLTHDVRIDPRTTPVTSTLQEG